VLYCATPKLNGEYGGGVIVNALISKEDFLKHVSIKRIFPKNMNYGCCIPWWKKE